MIKVLFIAYYFPPIGGAGVQRSLKFVQYLPSHDVHPVVITGPLPNEDRWTPEDVSLLAHLPGDISVYRSHGPVPEASHGVRKRLENWLFLPKPFSRWWVRSAVDTATPLLPRCDVLYATMSPFESAEIAHSLSIRSGVPWVADLRDPWALDDMQVYPSVIHKRYELHKMMRLLSTAHTIIMNTPEAVKALLSACPHFDEKRVLCIPNGFDKDDFATGIQPRSDNKFRIVHSGYLHTDIGIRRWHNTLRRYLGGTDLRVDILTRSHAVLLQALRLWVSRCPDVSEDIELVLAGKASQQDRLLAASSDVSALLRFTGYLPHSQSVNLLRTADVLFLPMHNVANGGRSRIVPGKTYEYMASGRPILAAVPEGDAKDFLRQCGTASFCDPTDPAGMAQLLEQYYLAWKAGRPSPAPDVSFLARFERRYQARELATALLSLAS